MLLDYGRGIVSRLIDDFDEFSATELHFHILLKHDGRSSMLCVQLTILTSNEKASDQRLDLKRCLSVPVLQELIAYFMDKVRLILYYKFR